MKTPASKFVLLLLLTVCFTLATVLQQFALNWSGARSQNANLMAIAIGDARHMLANQLMTEADVYFHSGYYPSIFDEAKTMNGNHLATSASEPEGHHGEHDDHEHGDEHKADFPANRPNDWIERFGRNFYVTEHTELVGVDTRELLPWLRMAAEMDATNQLTYTLGAFLLREHIKKPDQALQFLREGLRANPNSYDILHELGRTFYDGLHDTQRAENVWEKALQKWEETEGKSPDPDVTKYREILLQLAKSKEKASKYSEAIHYFTRLKPVAPHPEQIQKLIDELQRKAAVGTNAPPR